MGVLKICNLHAGGHSGSRIHSSIAMVYILLHCGEVGDEMNKICGKINIFN